jgi:hypothetical protein
MKQMSEEKKINPIKAFFSNPLSYVIMSITVGTFLFNLGGSSINRKSMAKKKENKYNN